MCRGSEQLPIFQLRVEVMKLATRTTLSQQPLACFAGERRGDRSSALHSSDIHSFVCRRECRERRRLTAVLQSQRDMKGSAWESGGRAHHIAALWARRPLSNYREPGRALVRHALNFAQDRWGGGGGLLNMQRSPAFPLLTAAACVDNVVPVAPEASYQG